MWTWGQPYPFLAGDFTFSSTIPTTRTTRTRGHLTQGSTSTSGGAHHSTTQRIFSSYFRTRRVPYHGEYVFHFRPIHHGGRVSLFVTPLWVRWFFLCFHGFRFTSSTFVGRLFVFTRFFGFVFFLYENLTSNVHRLPTRYGTYTRDHRATILVEYLTRNTHHLVLRGTVRVFENSSRTKLLICRLFRFLQREGVFCYRVNRTGTRVYHLLVYVVRGNF